MHRLRHLTPILPDRFILLPTAFAILATALVLLRVADGVGILGDARFYLVKAGALADGGPGLLYLIGQTTHPSWQDYLVSVGSPDWLTLDASVLWPPLYPTLLAVAGGFTFDPRDVAGPLNALIFGLTLFVAGQWLRRRIKSTFLVAQA